MSIHRSLVSAAALKRDRNVLTRAERVERLADVERWQEGDSVFGLAKVRVHKVRVGGKQKKAAKAEGAEETLAPEPDETS